MTKAESTSKEAQGGKKCHFHSLSYDHRPDQTRPGIMVMKHLLLSALLLVHRTTKTTTAAFFAHPSPGSDWETVHQYRQRQNITYNYQTKHINPELCRHVSEETCRADDEAAAHAHQDRNKRRRLNPRQGTFTFLVLLLQFSDHQNRALPPKEYYEELCNGSGPSAINPAGSISEFFAENSYGKFNIECRVQDWRLTDNTESFFAGGVKGLKGAERSQDMFRSVMDQIENESDQFFFFDLDRALDPSQEGDGNGSIELLVIHSGYSAEGAAIDCFGAAREDRFQSAGYRGTSSGAWTTSDGNFRVNGYAIASGFDIEGPENCASTPAKMGIMTVRCQMSMH